MILRPRQEQFVGRCVAALGEHGNTLGVAPTGAGKTVMLSAVIGRILDETHGERALVIQHRDELVEQNRRTFHALNGMARASGVVAADRKDWLKPIIFGMAQTISRDDNLAVMRPVDILVTDEAHHAAARSYRKIYDRARELNPNVLLFGVTATPNRGDKKALRGTYDNVADQITLGELIRTGALVPPRTFVVDLGVREDLQKVRRSASDFDMSEVAKIMDHSFLNDQIVAKWKETAGDRQTVVFCSTVEHAEHVTDAFVAAGVTARMVEGTMAGGERKAVLNAFDRGEFQVIVNVSVLTEGWDCQPVSCVVLLRPSSYASTMIQMIGRGLRRQDPEKYPNRPPKNDCIVIDFGTSILNHGTLEQHVNLDPRKGEAPQKKCPECDASVPASAYECGICGYEFPAEVDAPTGGNERAEKEVLKDFVLTEIDLFNASPFKWEALWDGLVLIATAFESWAMCIAYAGQWYAIGGARASGVHILNIGDKMIGLAAADDWMRQYGDTDAAAKSRMWLHMPATDKQLETLGVARALNNGMTRYQAACHITFKFQERVVREKIEATLRAAA